MKYLFGSLLICFTNLLPAQVHEWVMPLGGDWFDYGHAVFVDDSGYVYSTGQFSTRTDFDPGSGWFNISSQGFYDIYVHKADSAGNLVWAKGMGSNGFDSGEAIVADDSGNVYTTGYFTNTVDFDPGSGSLNLSSNGREDIFIQKLDASGNLVWAYSFGDSQFDRGSSIILDDSNNVYVTGTFMQFVDFDPDTSSFIVNSGSNPDAFILKLSANGDFLWVKTLDGISIQNGLSSALDAAGNLYTAGYFNGTADFDPGPGTSNLTAVNLEDAFIQKMDAAGNFLWAKSIGGTGNERAESIAVNAQGSVLITGHFDNQIDLNPDSNITLSRTSAGNEDIFMVKLYPQGLFAWGASFGSVGRDQGWSVAQDSYSNVYLTGEFANTVDFDPRVGTANLTSGGSSDVFLLKLDGAGNFNWAQSVGSFNIDVGKGICLDQNDGIYTTGYFQGQVDFDPGTGVDSKFGAGWNDIFVQKFSQLNNAVGIKKQPAANSIELQSYPNPNQGQVQIELAEPLKDVNLEIRDITGQLLQQEHFSSLQKTSISMEEQPAGVYFLWLQSQQGQTVIKLVKE